MFSLIGMNFLSHIKSTLIEKKMENIIIINTDGKSVMYKYIILATSLSSRHAKASVEFLLKNLKTIGVKKFSVHGIDLGDWVMVDLGDVAVHVINEEMRNFYDFEGMWINEEGCSTID